MSATPDGQRPEQEPDALPGRRLALAGAAVVVATFASLALTAWLLARATADRPEPQPSLRADELVGRIELGGIADSGRGRRLHDAARAALAQWAWVDREHGVARIPIEAAMRALAEDGAR
jgi:hypothetical protein